MPLYVTADDLTPRALPAAWGNITGFNLLSDPALAALGWFPVTDGQQPSYDPNTQRLAETVTISGNAATRSWAAEDLPLATAKQNLAAALIAKHAAVLEAGFTHAGRTWTAGQAERERLTLIVAGIAAGEGLPKGAATKTLKDAAGNAVALNEAQMRALGIAGRDFVSDVDEHAALLEAQIMAASTVAELPDINAGWPG